MIETISILSLCILFITSIYAGKWFNDHNKKVSEKYELLSRVFLILNLVVVCGTLVQLTMVWYYFSILLFLHSLISMFLVYYVLMVPNSKHTVALKYYMVVMYNFFMIGLMFFSNVFLEQLWLAILYGVFTCVYNLVEVRYLNIHNVHPHL